MDSQISIAPPRGATTEPRAHGPIRATWLLDRRAFAQLAAAYAGLTAVWFAIGWSIDHWFTSSIGRVDDEVEQWFVDQRTPTGNRWSLWGSWMGETVTKIAVTAVLAIVLLAVLKRWLEPLLLAVSLTLEAMVFISVTWLVDRPRPNVSHLDTSPVGSSFPSGHTAAAACYAAIAIVIFWHTRKVWIRAITVVLTVAIPVAVGVARMYRGMHHLTDVFFGVLLGAASVIITLWILERAAERNAVQHGVDAEQAELPWV